MALERVEGGVLGAQPQKRARLAGLPARLRFLSILVQDQAVCGPLRGAQEGQGQTSTYRIGANG